MIQIYKPKNPLVSDFIEIFWSLESVKSSDGPGELVTPEGCFEIYFNYGSPSIWTGSGAPSISFKRSFISGMRKEHFYVKSGGKSELLVLRFFPHALHPFLNIPMTEFTGKIVDLDLINNGFFSSLVCKTEEIPDMDKRIEIIEDELCSYICRNSLEVSKSLFFVLHAIHTLPAGTLIKAVCEARGISYKTIERLCKKCMGISPKYYSKVLRFTNVLEYIKEHNVTSWTDVAYDFGYYDQSHFIKDFYFFTGVRPGDLIC